MILKKDFLYLFFLISILELAIDLAWIPVPELRYAVKPALMISLMGFVLQNLDRKDALPLLITLFFALGGDVFLMFEAPIFFQLGLGSFLLMQILYIKTFLKEVKWKKFHWLYDTFFLVFVVGYVLFFLNLLWPGLVAGLQIPVVLYAIALGSMAYSAFLRKLYTWGDSYWLIFIGALFFVLSDSLLAYNKFVAPFSGNSFWVMSTYILAQLLLTLGLVNFVLRKR